MIAQLVQQIVANLGDQGRVYRSLLELSKAQARALAARDVQAVHAVLQEIEVAMVERGKAERRRNELVDAAARQLGISVDEVTATRLGQLAGVQAAEALASAAGQLKAIVAELDQVVGHNKASLEYELQIVDHLVQGLTRTSTPAHSQVYGRSGTVGDAPRLRILDAQV